MKRYRCFFSCLPIFLHLACQHRVAEKEATFDDTTFERLQKTQSLELEKGSPSLWSPAEKQVSANYYFLVGEYIALQGHEAKANELFKAAYELDPNAYLASKYVASQLQQTAESGEALRLAKKMVLLYPHSPELHLLLSETFLKNSQDQEALEAAQKALQLNPKYEQAYVQLIGLYQKEGARPQALKVAKEMTSQLPASILGWTIRSRLYEEKEAVQALQAARRAYELQTNNPQLVIAYAYFLESQGKQAEAYKLYQELFSQRLRQEDILPQTLIWIKTWGGAEEALQQWERLAATALGQHLPLQLHRVILLWELKRHEEALQVLEGLRVDAYPSPQLLYFIASALEKLGRKQEAVARYLEVPEASDYYIPARYRVSLLYKSEQKYEEALANLLALLPHKYANWELYILAAQILAERSQYQRAISLLEEGVSRYPSKVKLLFLRGVYEEKSQEIDRCVATMKQVIAQDPLFSSAYNYLGYLYAEQGRQLEEAQALILKALELQPQDGYYLDSLGWVYFRMGAYDKALPVLQQASELLPEEGVILEHLGDLYRALQQKQQASEHYDKALNSKLEDGDESRIRAKKASLDD